MNEWKRRLQQVETLRHEAKTVGPAGWLKGRWTSVSTQGKCGTVFEHNGCAVKLVPCRAQASPKSPEVIEMTLMEFLQETAIKETTTPHISLVIFAQHVPLAAVQRLPTLPADHGYLLLASEWAHLGTLEELAKSDDGIIDDQWQTLLWQTFQCLAVVQHKISGFRHNDLRADNVLVARAPIESVRYAERPAGAVWEIPTHGWCCRMCDFDFCTAVGVMDNRKVDSDSAKAWGICNDGSTAYDVYLLLTSLFIYTNPIVLDSTHTAAPKTREFVTQVLPSFLVGKSLVDFTNQCKLTREGRLLGHGSSPLAQPHTELDPSVLLRNTYFQDRMVSEPTSSGRHSARTFLVPPLPTTTTSVSRQPQQNPRCWVSDVGAVCNLTLDVFVEVLNNAPACIVSSNPTTENTIYGIWVFTGGCFVVSRAYPYNVQDGVPSDLRLCDVLVVHILREHHRREPQTECDKLAQRALWNLACEARAARTGRRIAHNFSQKLALENGGTEPAKGSWRRWYTQAQAVVTVRGRNPTEISLASSSGKYGEKVRMLSTMDGFECDFFELPVEWEKIQGTIFKIQVHCRGRARYSNEHGWVDVTIGTSPCGISSGNDTGPSAPVIYRNLLWCVEMQCYYGVGPQPTTNSFVEWVRNNTHTQCTC